MSRHLAKLVFGVLLVTFIASVGKSEDRKNGNDCVSFFRSSEVVRFTSQMKRLSSISDIWPGYRPETIPVLVSRNKPEVSNCVLIFQNGEITHEIVSGENLQFDNGLYFLYLYQPLGGSLPADILSVLIKTKIEKAIAYSIDAFPDTAGQLDYQIYMKGKMDFHLNTVVHEGFHINSIFGAIVGPRPFPWPAWDRQPDRDIGKFCYERDEWKKESYALHAAFKLLYLEGNTEMALSAARDFIKMREERYHKLKDVKVPSSHAPEGVSCEEAESIMELEEGGADFVGTAASIELAIVSPYQVSEHLVDYHDWYYRSGLAQLLLIRKMNKAASLEALQKISTSQNWNQGIFFEFKTFIESH